MDIWEELCEEDYNHQCDVLKAMGKNSIRLITETSDEASFAIGESKIGGLPHLPSDIEWPLANSRPMLFIAQIDLARIAKLDMDRLLPGEGMLYFFHSGLKLGYDPKHISDFKVIYHYGDVSQLQIAQLPEGLSKCFTPCKVTFKTEDSYPNYSTLLDNKSIFFDSEADEEEIDLFYDIILDSLFSERPINKLFGIPDLVQDWGEYNDIFLESQLVTNGIYYGDTNSYKSPLAHKLKAGVSE